MGSILGPLKRLCLTSEWSMSVAGGGGDGSGCPWGLLWLPLVLSPEARSGRCSPPQQRPTQCCVPANGQIVPPAPPRPRAGERMSPTSCSTGADPVPGGGHT